MILAKKTEDGKTTVIAYWRDNIASLTNNQLAEKLGTYHEEQISRIVNASQEPTKQLMKRFCYLMGSGVGELWEFDRELFEKSLLRGNGKEGK